MSTFLHYLSSTMFKTTEDTKLTKNSLLVDIVPPKKISGDYSIIKKWNDFLFEATGKTTKERKKEFGKVK